MDRFRSGQTTNRTISATSRLLKQPLQSLEAEIMYGHTPLHEAARKLVRTDFRSPINDFFQHLQINSTDLKQPSSDAWEESLKEIWGKTALKKR